VPILDGSGSSDNVGVVSYVWSFDHNGSLVMLEGRMVNFNFEIPGNYSVTLTVMDAAELSGTGIVNITVKQIFVGDDDTEDDDTTEPDNVTEKEGLSALAVVGIIMGIIVIITAVLFVLMLRRKKVNGGPDETNRGETYPSGPPTVTELHQPESAPDYGMQQQVLPTQNAQSPAVPIGESGGEAQGWPALAPVEEAQALPEAAEPPLPPPPE